MKPHTGFDSRFSIDMLSLTGKTSHEQFSRIVVIFFLSKNIFTRFFVKKQP
jgi:hypothetical protein